MAVRLRLKRVGARNHPVYRIVATDSRNPRDGKFIEQIGTYRPATFNRRMSQSEEGNSAAKKKTRRDVTELVNLDLERVDHWIQSGAQPSEKVWSFIRALRRKANTEQAAAAAD